MREIEQHRPHYSAQQAEDLARQLYELDGTAQALPSERDQNFLLTSNSTQKWVLKISNNAENVAILEFQNKAMAHLASQVDAGLFPRVLPSKDGQHICALKNPDGTTFKVRLLTHLEGTTLVDFRPHSKRLFYDFGQFLGRMDFALNSLEQRPPAQELLWDVDQATSVIESHLEFIKEPGRRAMVGRYLDLFQKTFLPRASQLRTSVIHNDANDHNVLVSPDEQIAGIIDFGDMHYSYTIHELAVALSYAMLDKHDPLGLGAQIVAGYHHQLPITDLELEMLYPLVVARLCTSVSVSAKRGQLFPDNDYLSVSERPAWVLLEQLEEIGPSFAHYVFRHACHQAPCPQTQDIETWIKKNQAEFAPILAEGVGSPLTFDLGVDSPELARLDLVSNTALFTKALFDHLAESSAAIGIGRYDEIRPIYRADSFRVTTDEGEEWRTLHLGLDLFAKPASPIYAPLDGRVHSFADNSGPLDYGPTIILEHQTPSGAFYTLYGHLSRGSLDGLAPGLEIGRGEPFAAIGETSVNGGWPPHLHFQIITDLLGRHGEFPGVARPSQRPIWLSISPNPEILLGKLAAPAKEPLEAERILDIRRQHLGRSLSISYRNPLKIIRGWQQYLYDEWGQPYLDGVNNVCHVGHCHPKVVHALQQQAAILNTNTRYLHDHLALYAERLCATLPDPLSVCFFVCTGSEANELALRLARTYTGQQDTVVLEGAYHGNTNALIDVSPYKHAGPGGSGPPPHVHAIPLPDPYRGRHRAPDQLLGNRYAKHVQAAIDRIHNAGRGLAAFMCEPLLSCGGQIVLPDDFLKLAYQHVHAAGGVCIADEVQVGFGRVGSHFWAFETQGVIPDIVTMGKPIGNGHPLAAVVTTAEIANAFANGMEYFNTFGGNPVSCAVGMAVMDVIEQEALQQNAWEVGSYLKEGLNRLKQKHSLIGDVRGLGLFLGVELVSDLEAKQPAAIEAKYVAERMRDHGILISTDGPDNNVLKIKPPIVFNKENADRLIAALDKIMAENRLRARPAHSSKSITGS